MSCGSRTPRSTSRSCSFARGPFGYFVGEYEGLASTGNTFWPLFAIGTGDPDNRTDIVTRTAAP